MGLTDLTLGWYEDASGLVITPPGRAAALEQYLVRLHVEHTWPMPRRARLGALVLGAGGISLTAVTWSGRSCASS
jgi:hypothetical protein